MTTRPTPGRFLRFPLVALGRETWARGTVAHPVWDRPRKLAHHEFWFVWGGSGELSGRNGPQRLCQGKAVLLAPGTRHRVTCDPASPLSVNYFEIAAAPRCLPRRTLVAEVLDGAFYEAATRRILELFWQAFADNGWKAGPASPKVKFTREPEVVRKGAFCPNPIRMTSPPKAVSHPALRIAGNLVEVLIDDFLLRASAVPAPMPRALGLARRHRDAMHAIADEIRRDPAKHASLVLLARNAGYSPDHFSRIFHRVVGTSPKAFVLAARIERAKTLLARSDLTIKEIADSLGYSSPYFFSRQFRAAAGLAPSAFRSRVLRT